MVTELDQVHEWIADWSTRSDVQRQHSGAAGRPENCQIGTFLAEPPCTGMP